MDNKYRFTAYSLLLAFFLISAALIIGSVSRTGSFGASVKSGVDQLFYSDKYLDSITDPKIRTALNTSFQFRQPSRGEIVLDIPMSIYEKGVPGWYKLATGDRRDSFGYPRLVNEFHKIKGQRGGGNKSDEDESIPGMFNCRADESVTGYFRAYFEEVALSNAEGFDDPTFGELRRNEACQVLEDIASLIKLDETETTPEILFMQNPGNIGAQIPSNVLGAASTYFPNDDLGLNTGDMWSHIITGVDPAPTLGDFDAYVILNFYGVIDWDVDSSLNVGTYDFYSVLYHEILHTLGFRSRLPSSVPENQDLIWYSLFDTFIFENDLANLPFIQGGETNADVGSPSPDYVTNEVVYNGVPNIFESLSSGLRPIYSPTSWEQGSSLSHFDINRADNGQEYIMHPSIGTNTERQIHQEEKEVLCHLGYAVSGLSQCEDFSPVTVNDLVTSPYDFVCVNPTSNDSDFNNEGLVFSEFSLLSGIPDDDILYFSGQNCTGTSSNDFVGKKSFSLDFSDEEVPSQKIFSYQVMGQDSERLSNFSNISVGVCDVEYGEYVCNGGFEQGVAEDSDLDGQSFVCAENWSGTSRATGWCNGDGTPDLFIRDNESTGSCTFSPGYGIPLSCKSNTLGNPGGVETPTVANNDRYGGVIVDYANNGSEMFVGTLVNPLIPGVIYKLDMYANPRRSTLLNAPEEGHVMVGLADEFSPAYYNMFTEDTGTEAENDVILYSEMTVADEWTHIVEYFTVPYPMYYITLSGDYNQVSAYFYNFFDNVSIREAEVGDLFEGVDVSGIVFHDLNGNGNKDIVEPGIGGVSITLYNISDGVNEIELGSELSSYLPSPGGEFIFNDVDPGTYALIMQTEDSFEDITTPEFSSDGVDGFNYPIIFEVEENDIEDLEFGIDLPGDASQASISGYVFQDVDADGQIDETEEYLADKILFLFEEENLELPIDSFVTSEDGFYEFDNLSNGSYVVVMDEAGIPGVTVPTDSSIEVLGSTNNYVYPLNGIEVIENANFGISNGSTDIGIRKYLVDDTLSFFDRQITYRIDVLNEGPSDAFDIVVLDLIPSGFLYVSHSTPDPDETYNPNTGNLFIPYIESEDSTFLLLTVKVPKKLCGDRINTATLVSLLGEDISSGNNSGSVSIDLPDCQISAPSGVPGAGPGLEAVKDK